MFLHFLKLTKYIITSFQLYFVYTLCLKNFFVIFNARLSDNFYQRFMLLFFFYKLIWNQISIKNKTRNIIFMAIIIKFSFNCCL